MKSFPRPRWSSSFSVKAWHFMSCNQRLLWELSITSQKHCWPVGSRRLFLLCHWNHCLEPFSRPCQEYAIHIDIQMMIFLNYHMAVTPFSAQKTLRPQWSNNSIPFRGTSFQSQLAKKKRQNKHNQQDSYLKYTQPKPFIQSFILRIYIVPPQVTYSEAFPAHWQLKVWFEEMISLSKAASAGSMGRNNRWRASHLPIRSVSSWDQQLHCLHPCWRVQSAVRLETCWKDSDK